MGIVFSNQTYLKYDNIKVFEVIAFISITIHSFLWVIF